MNKVFKYDGQDKAQRKNLNKVLNFNSIAAFFIVEALLVLFCIGICFLILFTNAGEPLSVLGIFLGLNIPVVFVILFFLLIFKIMFKNLRFQYLITDDCATYTEENTLTNLNFVVNYSNIDKVYIKSFAKTKLWNKMVPYYPVSCEVKQLIKNGEICKFRKKQTKSLFYAESLQEAEEIVEFVRSKMVN